MFPAVEKQRLEAIFGKDESIKKLFVISLTIAAMGCSKMKVNNSREGGQLKCDCVDLFIT